MTMEIRHERPEDVRAIAAVTEEAFRDEVHSSHTEQFIIDALRRAGVLAISLVAEEGGEIIGHVAISPVTISSRAERWYGLGPISVRPDRQGLGIGTQLMKAALEELRRFGGAGCVVVGEPAFYGRFGFAHHAGLELPDVPAEYFQAVMLEGEIPTGVVCYHEAFSATM